LEAAEARNASSVAVVTEAEIAPFAADSSALAAVSDSNCFSFNRVLAMIFLLKKNYNYIIFNRASKITVCT
jgi:hypothetical protein